MIITDHVSSLELSKKLLELGVKQESIFYWADGSIVSPIHLDLLLDDGKVRSLSGVYNSWPDTDTFDLYSAFTVSELGELLPCLIDDGIDFYYPNYTKQQKYYRVQLLSDTNKMLFNITEDKETDLRAKMLICLIENGYIKND